MLNYNLKIRMGYFITNNGAKDLKKRLNQLISVSEEIKALVGFFYFSGLKELYDGLRKNPSLTLKVLVGRNVDRTIYGLIEYGENSKGASDREKVDEYFASIKKSLNSEDFDNKEFYEQARFFIDLIREGRLIIRKTHKPNHAKLYIFKLNEMQIARRELFITGSSNLTYYGLSYQDEFNVEISDFGFQEAEKYFDNLWERAIKITEDDVIKKELISLVEEKTLLRKITPFEAYVYVLKSYIDSYQGKDLSLALEELLEKKGYRKYKYQLDAVKQAISIIDRNNGVIIADVVGLGKTIIACAVAYELKKRGIVIAPPGLIGDDAATEGWNKYLEDFHLASLGWKAFSSGDLEKAANYVSRAKDIEVVIVDEAHRFRNQDTKSYELLKNICRGKIVILLTATPFNNKPSDIFSLLKLFITPKKSTITLSDDLEARFTEYKTTFEKLSHIKKYANSSDSKKRKKAIIYYENLFGSREIDLEEVNKRTRYLARQIKKTIEPVVIRRNRLDILENPEYCKEVKELSRVEDPKEWFFELTKEQSEFYDKVIREYFARPEEGGLFKGAIYRPFIYKLGLDREEDIEEDENTRRRIEDRFKYEQQFNLYDFMRRLLVKRFESSFGAFKKSLENFKRITEIVLSFVERTGKYILDRKLLESIHDLELEEIEKELEEYARKIKEGRYPEYHEVYEIEKFRDKEKFLSHIKSDKELFEKILRELEELNLIDNDPKVKTLIEKLKESLNKEPNRKIIIFSEYADTVKYLGDILKREFNNRVLVVVGNLNSSKTREIYENFDASYPEEKQKNEYDILVTTDKLSEGFNLNRAGMVINYDIPWNPVRVIQRVGRINRIGRKVFDSLYIVNFFPTEKGADFVRSKEIAAHKMFLIHHTLGEDSKIFAPDEEPSPSRLYERIQENPDKLEEESFYTKVLKEFREIEASYPDIIERLRDLPPRIKVAKASDKDELFVIFKKGSLFVYYTDYNSREPKLVDLEEIIERLKPTHPEDEALELSKQFWGGYEKIKAFKEHRHALRELSLEQKAINNLNTILGNSKIDIDIRRFAAMLRDDILYYGTLPDYTLRRIVDIKTENVIEVHEKLKALREELGENYLLKEKERLKRVEKDIIIAIENIKV